MEYKYSKGKFTEVELEKAIIEPSEQRSNTYVCGKNMHRKYDDLHLLDDLRT